MSILLITTDKDSNVARALLTNYNITVLLPSQADLFLHWNAYEYVITYRCPWIIPKHILHLFIQENIVAINIHPSLLPLYAGLNPWQQMFSNNEKTGGVTIHLISEEVDAGEILQQQSMPIFPTDTIDSARQRADELAANMIINLIKQG